MPSREDLEQSVLEAVKKLSQFKELKDKESYLKWLQEADDTLWTMLDYEESDEDDPSPFGCTVYGHKENCRCCD